MPSSGGPDSRAISQASPAGDAAEANGEGIGRTRPLPWAGSFVEGGRLRDARFTAAVPLLLVFGIGAGVWILWLTRRYDFYADEWDFVLGVRTWSIGHYFFPHNEHWSTIPALIYRLMLQVVGTRSYLPYMSVLMVLHVLTAMLLFLLIRRRAGDILAFAAGMVLLVLGQAWEDLLWAFQIGFVGACALGLLAILLLTSRPMPVWKGVLGSLSILGALMMSGPGLVFLVFVGVALIIPADQRRRVIYLVGPTTILIVWYVIIGHKGLAHTPITVGWSASSVDLLHLLLQLVSLGLGTTTAGLVGLSAQWSTLGLVALVLIVGAGWATHRPSSVAIGAGVGLVTEYLLIGLADGDKFGDLVTAASRYIYIAAVCLLIILAEVAGQLRWRPALVPVSAVALMIVIPINVWVLGQQSVTRYETAIQGGQVSQQVAWTFRDAPGLRRKASVDDSVMRGHSVRLYLRNRELYGSPLPSLTPAQVGRLPGPLVDRAMNHLLPPHASTRAATVPESACVPEPAGGLSVNAGSSVVVRSTAAGFVDVFASHYAPPSGNPAASVTLKSLQDEVSLRMADMGIPFTWHIVLVGPSAAEMLVCPP